MSNPPTVSVVMAVYNTPVGYLRAAVQSILTQTLKDFEFIIVNDSSTQPAVAQCLKQAAAKDKRIRILTNRTNLGLTRSLNKALAQARGQFIARMDADDISLPQRLKTQVEYLQTNPRIALCGTNLQTFGKVEGAITHPATQQELFYSFIDNETPVLAHPTVVVRRLLVENADFHYDESIRYAQDFALWQTLLQKGCLMANLPQALVRYRIHNGALSHAQAGGQQQTRYAARLARYQHLLGRPLTQAEAAYIDARQPPAPFNARRFRAECLSRIPAVSRPLAKARFRALEGQKAKTLLAMLRGGKIGPLQALWQTRASPAALWHCLAVVLKKVLKTGAQQGTAPNPRIAVLLPACNAQATIGAALQSLQAQTYPHFDIFVINDGSTDATAAIVAGMAKADSRIKLIHNKTNLKLIATLNKGLNLITAMPQYTYIARQDADDLSLPTRFARQVAFMAKHPGLDFCSTTMRFKGLYRGLFVFPATPLGARYAALAMVCPVGHASALMKVSMFQNKRHRYNPAYPHAEDAHLWSVLTKKYNVASLKDPLYVYDFHPHNVSNLNQAEQRRSADKVIEEEFARFLHRKLKPPEHAFINHDAANFAAYLAFYEQTLDNIINAEPAFVADPDCRKLVARIVARTIYMNHRTMLATNLWRMVQSLMLKRMRMGLPRTAYLIVRIMVLIKTGRHNAL